MSFAAPELASTPCPVSEIDVDDQAGLDFEPIPEKPESPGFETTVIKRRARFENAGIENTLEFPTNPADLKDTRVGVIVDGLGGKCFAYSLLRRALVQKTQKPWISMNPHARPNWEEALPYIAYRIRNDFDLNRLRHPERDLGRGLLAVIRLIQSHNEDYEHLDVSEFDLVSHSYGLPVSVAFAERHPALVRSIVDLEGAGTEDRHDLARFFPRLPNAIASGIPRIRENRHELQRDKSLSRILLAVAEDIVLDPARAGAEMIGAGTANANPGIEKINTKYGIGVAAVFGEYDGLIPARESIAGADGLLNPVKIVKSDHIGPALEPGLFVEAINESLDTLHEKPKTALNPAA